MYPEIYQCLADRGQVKSAAVLTGIHAGARCMVSDNGEILCRESGVDWAPYLSRIMEAKETKVLAGDGQEILVELFLSTPRLVILGGGHVALAAARLGRMLGFHVTVMDDREEFVSPARFSDADELICGDFSEIPEKIPVRENTYYVVLTRGHAADAECVRHILKRPYRYLGMIGSRRKVKLTWDMLLKEGYTQEQLDSVYAPVGLSIGSQTPEEIGVSILAQIIQVKNSGFSAYADPEVAGAVLAGHSGVMMTIIKKSGSSPRGVGSKMFLDERGKAYGSIGGGGVEYASLKHALLTEEAEVKSFSLSGEDAAGEGMICGGKVEVFFEPVGKFAENTDSGEKVLA